MAFRLRKSKSIGGFRVNLSKKGIGWSVGTKGARYTQKSDGGTRSTLSIPGTGISYVKEGGKKKGRVCADQLTSRRTLSTYAVVFKVLGITFIPLSLLLLLASPLAGLGGVAASIGCFLLSKYSKKKAQEAAELEVSAK